MAPGFGTGPFHLASPSFSYRHRTSATRDVGSSSCLANGCVEVDFTSAGVQISHSKIAGSPVITFTTGQWSAWLTEVTADHLTNNNGAVTVTAAPDTWTVYCIDTGHTLVFDETEWAAFRLGATNGEFDPSLSRELATT
ncbi:MAG: DUF397 domain-containing protein [Pseudonocardiaceae bacterium]